MQTGNDGVRLSAEDFAKIKRLGVRRHFSKGERIFSGGDSADCIYFIEAGHVYIFTETAASEEAVATLGAGEYFGEIAFFDGGPRAAAAAALRDSTLVLVDRARFRELSNSDQALVSRINSPGAKTLGDGRAAPEIKVGIKGEPASRDTVLRRERDASVVDRIIVELQPRLYDLLLHRTACEVFIHCDSGEARIRTVLDPFSDEIHPVARLLNVAYLDRHFPLMGYSEKTEMIRRVHGFIGADEGAGRLPQAFAADRRNRLAEWKPVSRQELARTISRLAHLRRIPNLHLRNFTISTVRDAIRMQFNGDGTRIVSARGLQQFINDNLVDGEFGGQGGVERRVRQRRSPEHQGMQPNGERRSPPGRRLEDWQVLIDAPGPGA